MFWSGEEVDAQLEAIAAVADPESLLAVLTWHSRVTAAVGAAVGRFDVAGSWGLDGATSMTAWLAGQAGMSRREAGSWVRRQRRLTVWPVTAGLLAGGGLSVGQIDAVCGLVPEPLVGLFADHEPEVVPALVGLSVADTVRVVRHWVAMADAVTDGPEPPEPTQSLTVVQSLDGLWHVRGTLSRDNGAELVAVLARFTPVPLDGEPVVAASERRADALMALVRAGDVADQVVGSLPDGVVARGSRRTPTINVVMTIDQLAHARPVAETLDADLVTGPVVRRMLCDAIIHRVITGPASEILDYGRGTRVVPTPLFRATALRDHHCRFPGCDRPASWCDAHHVNPWWPNGPTRIGNLALLCTRHHHLIHQPGWQLTMSPQAVITVTTPTGRILTSHPPGILSSA